MWAGDDCGTAGRQERHRTVDQRRVVESVDITRRMRVDELRRDARGRVATYGRCGMAGVRQGWPMVVICTYVIYRDGQRM